MPQITVLNESTAITDDAIKHMVPAFAHQWNVDLDPVWGVGWASFAFIPKGMKPKDKTWWVVFFDNSDQAGALAYHDLTNEGLPIAKVFVKTLLGDKQSVSVGATHEIVEMAVDPWLNSAYQDQTGTFWAGECADPCEADQYGYMIGDVLVTDFVTPNWFAHEHAQGALDFKGHVKEAFEVLPGGYAQKFDPTQGWQQVYGSKASRAEPQAGCRRERRVKNLVRRGERSEVVL